MPDACMSFWRSFTDCAAWKATKGAKGCAQEETPPYSSIRWGLAATKGALSWLHLDSNGFNTYVDTKSGFKWWIIGRRKGEEHCFESFSEVEAFFDGNHHVERPDAEKWDFEAVLLLPGTRL